LDLLWCHDAPFFGVTLSRQEASRPVFRNAEALFSEALKLPAREDRFEALWMLKTSGAEERPSKGTRRQSDDGTYNYAAL
jgi:hypothetical protein